MRLAPAIAPCLLRVSVAVVAVTACTGGAAMHHARLGDVTALKSDLDQRAAQGKLDDGEMRDVSRALLAHDIERYSGDEGARRMASLGGCARPLKDALKKAASGTDEVAATAATVLVDASLASIDAFTDDHRDDPLPAWRAVATRGLIDRKEHALRSKRAIDDDAAVRRAAVEAAGDAACARDFPLLLEAARKDPVVMVRIEAVRALAKIGDRLETDTLKADLVDRMNDLWAGGDDALRGAVARAWGMKALFPMGGRARLEVAVGSAHGHPLVEAASTLMGAGDVGGELALERLATQSEPSIRAHALRLLDPSRSRHRDALLKAVAPPEKGALDDVLAREIAAESLLRWPADRPKAISTLRALMQRPDKIGSDAAVALGNASVVEAKERLILDLRTDSFVRFRAASALVHLGLAGETRGLLSTADVDVRDGAACAVLGTPAP